jgi:hypothetical protein
MVTRQADAAKRLSRQPLGTTVLFYGYPRLDVEVMLRRDYSALRFSEQYPEALSWTYDYRYFVL